jgi:hypothetical protein
LENFDHNRIHVRHDPLLGGFTAHICGGANRDKAWSKLLRNSTHINLLVDLDNDWNLVPNKVQDNLENNNTIIVNMSADPFRGWEERIVKQLENYTDSFVVLSGDVVYLTESRENICFVPYLYLWQKYHYDTVRQIHSHRRYKISCMNKMARYHRIENFIKLRKKSYFSELLFHMWYYYNKKTVKKQCPRIFYDKNIIDEFESLIPEHLSEFDDEDPHAINLPAYTDSYVNLVTETSIYENTLFISEKTWRPFMCGQFGLWLGNPGSVEHLRSLGFDVFDDLFENHHYDSESNLNQRIDRIHSIIDRIMTLGLEQIWEATLDRRQSNVDRFYSQELENLLTAQCEKYLHLV